MDRQLLRQKVCQIISEMKTDPCVLVVFKTKRELKCQNKLSLFLWKDSVFAFISENI